MERYRNSISFYLRDKNFDERQYRHSKEAEKLAKEKASNIDF